MYTKKGFTLIELLVVVAIIGVLATIVMAVLSSSRDKGKDAKIVAQLGQMNSQSFLFSGAMPSTPVVMGPYQVSAGITGVPNTPTVGLGTAASGTLFNATSSSLNSLYSLAESLPSSTYIYYGWDGANPNFTGRWFFAASTSTGAFCNDNKGTKKVFTGTSPVDLSGFTDAFPLANSTTYSC